MSGRGAYYKEKYGNKGGRGGGGRGGRGGNRDSGSSDQNHNPTTGGGTFDDLSGLLRNIDGKQYPCYKDLYGTWKFKDKFTLSVDHVQGDAFASPSRFHINIPFSVSQIPPELHNTKVRQIAVRDFLARRFGEAVAKAGGDVRLGGGGWHSAKGGDMTVDVPGQAILERTAVVFTNDSIEARFTIGLPASGRSIQGQLAYKSLVELLPKYVQQALLYSSLDTNALSNHVKTAEDADFLRGKLTEMGLVAFIADGSILPRSTGASDKPMESAAVSFSAPESLAKTVRLPNRGEVRGLGIPSGVTLITGGGFHGKSTLLKAIERGVYNHILGDGRELVVTVNTAVKIRAEDGRCISSVDISPFINNLPYGKSTTCFSSKDASGSTSQAANILEALEVGCSCLLLDEDTCATNFMVRDERMQSLVPRGKEPITPFIDHVAQLYSPSKSGSSSTHAGGVSTVMVVGACGQFFDVADTVLLMDSFKPVDVTARALEISKQYSQNKQPSDSLPGNKGPEFNPFPPRLVSSLLPLQDRGEGDRGFGVKVVTRRKEIVQLGDNELDLGGLEQIVDISQTRAIADAIVLLHQILQESNGSGKASSGGKVLQFSRKPSVLEIVDQLEAAFNGESALDVLGSGRFIGNYARPRRFEMAAALNRLRSASISQQVKKN